MYSEIAWAYDGSARSSAAERSPSSSRPADRRKITPSYALTAQAFRKPPEEPMIGGDDEEPDDSSDDYTGV